jgi:K(+)-stimulated pyrophosphate-energized sodium pump
MTFLIGACISITCGAVGMVIATMANYRTTYCAKSGLVDAFRTAYRAGCGMGFFLVSLGLLGKFHWMLSDYSSDLHLR